MYMSDIAMFGGDRIYRQTVRSPFIVSPLGPERRRQQTMYRHGLSEKPAKVSHVDWLEKTYSD